MVAHANTRGMRWIVRLAAAALVAVGCTKLLPERYALNAPISNLMWGGGIAVATPGEIDARLRAPDGYGVVVWASELPTVRFMRFTETGDLLVSQPRQGKITLLARDANGDGRADGAQTVIEDLNRPHGLDLHDGWLWIAEMDAVGRIRFDAATRKTSGTYQRVITGLPSGGNHWTRTLRVGPAARLYVTVGSSCNVCLEEDKRRAAMLRFDMNGGGMELYATGLRNAVGFDWQPGTGDLYATDNGRDLLGDDFPPCELDKIVPGGFYGWPLANGDRVPDPDYGKGHEAEIAKSIPPAHGFHPHNAPLGMTFVRGDGPFVGDALVALHGSWNRTTKDGYKVVRLHWEPDGRIVESDFLAGFLKDENVIGRPVDVAEGPDGAIYVSDDYAGAIYRVAKGAVAAPAATTAPVAAKDPFGGMEAAERARRAQSGARMWNDGGCATCHDPKNAAPGMVTKRLEHLSARWTVDGLVAFFAAPTPPMPAVERPENDRRDLAVYVLTEHP
jgi:glucose/arabinose dehydrogenase